MPVGGLLRRAGALAIVIVVVSGCSSSTATPTAAQTAAGSIAPSAAQTAAGSIAPSAGAKVYKFAAVQVVVTPWYNSWPQAMQDVSNDFSIPVPLIGAPQTFDQTQQNNVIDGLVGRSVNGIAMQPVDAVAGNETIKRLVSQGIFVVGTGGCSQTMGAGAAFCFMSDTENEAYTATTQLINAMGGKGTIVHLAGQTADVATPLRIAGVNKAVSEHTGITLLQTLTDIDTAQAAQSAVSNLLSAKASQIDGIVSTAGNPSIAWAAVATQRKETRIKSVLIDDDSSVLAAISAGYVTGTMAAAAYMQVYIAMHSLKLLVDGCTWKDPSKQIVDAPYLWTDKSNVATLEAVQVARTKTMDSTWQATYWNCP